jgi:D-sedoheptulose 7-phosphate isomerase
MEETIKAECRKIAGYFTALQDCAAPISQAAALCIGALRQGNKILFCGNGGSAADAQHLAAELVGRYKLSRQALAGLALTVDTSVLTAVANDFGYDAVFSRQVEGLGRPGDVLFALSTSGNSPNVLAAVASARERGIKSVGMTGMAGGQLKELADVAVCVPATAANHIQEMHIAVGHLVCDFIEQALAHD